MSELKIKLTNELKKGDINSYDLSSLDVNITIISEEKYLIKDISFRVVVQQLNASSFYDESDIDVYEEYMMFPDDDTKNQQKHINNQIKLPLEIEGEKSIDFNVKIKSENSKLFNFLDIIKSAPSYILKDESQFELYIQCIINAEKENEVSDYEIFIIDNPLFKGVSFNF